MSENLGSPSRLVGILGGMGPSATVDFYDKLVRHTPAKQDQDHIRVIIWADPTVPSRQEALLTGGVDPTPWLRDGVRKIVACGADILVVPCNTAHAYLPDVMRDAPVEFISIIDATIETLHRRCRERVGLLTTDGALTAGLFQSALEDAAIEWVLPSPKQQQSLMDLVASVKAGTATPHVNEQLADMLVDLHGRGVTTTIAGCTEISTLLNEVLLGEGIEVVDPALELALKTIERAMESHG